MTSPGPVIQFSNVGLRYGSGDEVLRDVGFALNPGNFYFLTGRSGAGKSSLLKLMYLHHRPSRGLINLFGKDVATASRDELPALRRHIGVVFQEFRLLDHLTAYENIALPLKITGEAEKDYKANVLELMEWVGLKDRVNARPSTLSGGEQQRVAIARAVVNRPRLLLADEPTGNVDPDMARRLLRLFEELNRTGTTIVIASHDYGLISESNHPTLHIDGGEVNLLAPGTPPAPAAPASQHTASGDAADHGGSGNGAGWFGTL